jgi:hypothetical protein
LDQATADDIVGGAAFLWNAELWEVDMGDFERQLKKFQQELRKKVERVSADTNIGELLNDSFMRRYTDFSSFGAMVEAGGWGPATAETIKAIPDAEWETIVKKHTRFGSWQQMQKQAQEEMITERLR